MTTLWESSLARVREKVSEHTYAAWLAPVRFEGIEGTTVRLRTPSRFFVDWITTHYLSQLLEALTLESGVSGLLVEWTVDPSLAAVPASAETAAVVDGAASSDLTPPAGAAATGLDRRVALAASAAPRRVDEGRRAKTSSRAMELAFGDPPPRLATPASGILARIAPAGPPDGADLRPDPHGLNPRYVFDNFVVGTSNQLAHAAAQAAATTPGRKYNPLFIYSKVGLGKTHLVNAVGHRVRADRPSARILFLSAERFTNEFIWGLQNKRIDEFRARYRTNCDVLIIDDIQFLAGREQTQEEFFHTFNALYHADRQIIVTSDVNPREIVEMQERLISRFQWGLVADIQAPELDTRIAILQKKAEQEELSLDPEVALFIAQMVQSNVRELEGTLLRLAVRAELERRGLDLDLARSMLGAEKRAMAGDRQTSVEDVQRASAEYFGIGLKDLRSERRHRAVALPRMVAMYVARERLKLSYPDIGMRFGGKDHTTVMNAHRKIGAQALTDESVKRAIEAIERKLGLA